MKKETRTKDCGELREGLSRRPGKGKKTIMTKEQETLYTFFSDKAKHLQKEIDYEIDHIGGAENLITRMDVLHWVHHTRNQIETYHTVCRMLEDRADGADPGKILADLRENMESDNAEIDALHKKQEEERKALAQLREEAEQYRLVLEMLEK